MRRAFTLIELLTVVAIVAVLAAILFPVFARGKAMAKASGCVSNLRQIGLAHALYEGDHDAHTVPAHYFTDYQASDDYGEQFWYGSVQWRKGVQKADGRKGLLQPYLRGDLLAACPAAPHLVDPFGIPLDYGINFNLRRVVLTQGPGAALSNHVGIAASEIEAPAETVLFADSAHFNGEMAAMPDLERPSSPSPKYSTVHARHSGNANVAWCDGHARAMHVSFVIDSPKVAQDRANDLGDLVDPRYPFDGCMRKTASGECAEDFYFLLAKPTS